MQSDELSLRVGQLGSASTRARLARALRGAIEQADRRPDPHRMPPAAIRRSEIRANRALLLELAECLCSHRPLGVEGLALTSLLIHDAASPLYHKDAGRSLPVSVRSARRARARSHDREHQRRLTTPSPGLSALAQRNGCPTQWPRPAQGGMLDR
jgi:hypothetical protein